MQQGSSQPAAEGRAALPRALATHLRSRRARSAEPIQQWSLEMEPGKEVEALIDRLKAHFAATGPAKSAAQLKRQQVGREVVAAST